MLRSNADAEGYCAMLLWKEGTRGFWLMVRAKQGRDAVAVGRGMIVWSSCGLLAEIEKGKLLGKLL